MYYALRSVYSVYLLTFDVLDLGNQIASGKLTQDLVGSSMAQLCDLGDDRGGNNLVVLGAHLSLFN